MAERYTRLFSLTENLYQSGAPLLIAAGALLKDNQTNKTLAQIKFQSLSDKPIKAAKVTITPLDVVGNELDEAVEHPYLDLNIQRDEAFGAKSPIALPDATTRAFRAAVTSVVFADNTVWEASDAAWAPLPAPVMLDKVYPDAELRKQFKLEFGVQSQYAYAEFADLCRCPCGTLNRQEEAKCHTCGCDLTALRTLDVGELEKRKDDRLEQEKRAEEERQERERIAKEKAAVEATERAKKAKKIALIAAPFVCAVIAFLIVLSSVIIPSTKYNKAIELLEAERNEEALKLFLSLNDYKDAEEHAVQLSVSLWDQVTGRKQTIAAGMNHTVALKLDGTVVAVGSNSHGQCDVSGWTDIVAVAAGNYHTVGLKLDGTVVAVGSNGRGQCDVSGWTDIVAIAAGACHTVGLRSDGTVVAVGENLYDQCDVSDWSDIVAIAGGDEHTIGIRSDGTVVAVGENDYGRCAVGAWRDIVSVTAAAFHTVGLKSDGTVVAVGDNFYGKCDASNWRHIVSVAANDFHTVGLTSGGRAVAVGNENEGKCDVSGWTSIVAIAAGFSHTVGLKSDGTLVATGRNDDGQCDVYEFTDIMLPK